MGKVIITVATIVAVFSLAGCKEEKPTAVAPPQDINVNGPGQSAPAPGPLVLPEKGKYKY